MPHYTTFQRAQPTGRNRRVGYEALPEPKYNLRNRLLDQKTDIRQLHVDRVLTAKEYESGYELIGTQYISVSGQTAKPKPTLKRRILSKLQLVEIM